MKQGLANAVGMAMAEAHLREVFGADLIDHHTYVLAGDGDSLQQVRRDLEHAQDAGARPAPTPFGTGRYLAGPPGCDALRAPVEEELVTSRRE